MGQRDENPGDIAGPRSDRALRRSGVGSVIAMLPALPLMAWIALFILVPMGTMAVFSLWRYHDFDLEPVWNFGNYWAVVTQPVYARVMVRTLEIAGLVTIGCIALAYPF